MTTISDLAEAQKTCYVVNLVRWVPNPLTASGQRKKSKKKQKH